MLHILDHAFFNRSASKVAQELLGKFLVRKWRGQEMRHMITEVEAYVGPHDLACHASRGLTPRTRVMFGPAGHWYVYFTYGMHWMLNIVTGELGYPAAVLIRGVENVSGPARLTKSLRIDKRFNGKPANRTTRLWVEESGVILEKKHIQRSKRIGVSYAGPIWSNKLYRFILVGNRKKQT